MKRCAVVLSVLVTMVALTAGCGGGGGEDDGGPGGSDSYLPLAIGNRWDYTFTLAPDVVPTQAGENQEFPYHETVVGFASLAGAEYYVIETVREAALGYAESKWQQFRRETEDAIEARVGDPAYDLPVLRLPPVQGDTWTDPFFPEVTFTVAATDEQVTVTAGTFRCVRVDQEYDKMLEGEQSPVHITVRSWYARGVGMVQEETLEDDAVTSSLELLSYDLN